MTIARPGYWSPAWPPRSRADGTLRSPWSHRLTRQGGGMSGQALMAADTVTATGDTTPAAHAATVLYAPLG